MSKANDFEESWKCLGLKYGEEPYPIKGDGPFLIRSEDIKNFRAIEILHQMVEKATRLYLQGEFRELFDFPLPLQDLIEIDPGYDETCPIGRWDSFYERGVLKMLELNTDGTSGMGYVDALNNIYAMHHNIKPGGDILKEAVLQTLLICYQNFKNRREDKPQIAIVDWRGVLTESEQMRTVEYFIQRGFKTILADPRELHYDGRCLWKNHFRIDLVYRRVVTSEYLAELSSLNALTQGYHEQDLCMVGSFRSQIGFDKRLFVIFSSPKYARFFTSDEWEMSAGIIPWTRLLMTQDTLFRNELFQIPKDLIQMKDFFILKPPDLNRGKDIHFGESYSHSQWSDLIKDRLNKGFIVQEKIEVPIWGDGRWGLHLGHFIFSGKLAGWMARISRDAFLGDQAEEYLIPCLNSSEGEL